jgi:hypothetical protein
MGLFDSFSVPSVDNVVANIKTAANAGLNALNPNSTQLGTSANGSSSSNGYYKVLIQAILPSNEIIHLVADGPTDFAFSTALSYESPYQDLGEHALSAVLPDGFAGKAAESLIHGSGTRMFTQALTAKVWTGASETTISVPLIFQAESDAEADVLMPLMQLMFLSMPREATDGGFLSGPGPVFDWSSVTQPRPNNASAYTSGVTAEFPGNIGGIVPTSGGNPLGGIGALFSDVVSNGKGTLTDAFSAFRSGGTADAANAALSGANKTLAGISNDLKKLVKYPITLQIGQGFRLDNVVIESVQQTHSLRPVGDSYNHSSGINSRVQVDVIFKTFYTLTQRDIMKMLMPMNKQGSKTAAAYQRYLGN